MNFHPLKKSKVSHCCHKNLVDTTLSSHQVVVPRSWPSYGGEKKLGYHNFWMADFVLIGKYIAFMFLTCFVTFTPIPEVL